MPGGIDIAAGVVEQSAGSDDHVLVAVGPTLFDAAKGSLGGRGQASFKAKVVADALREMHLDAWTPAPHDAEEAEDAWLELAATTGARVVAVNHDLGGAAVPHVVLRRGSRKIGVTGAIVGDGVPSTPADRAATARALARALAALRDEEAEITVVLLSGSRERATHLLEQTPGFDLAVLSASESPSDAKAPPPAQLVGKTQVLAPPAGLHGVSEASFSSPAAPAVVRKLEMRADSPRSATVAALLDDYRSVVEGLETPRIEQPPGALVARSVYVGSERCTACHDLAHVSWNNTPHARAWWTLQTLRRTRDLDCVGCHTTGYDEPGGVSGAAVEGLQAVQCEACHGPGSAHCDAPRRHPMQARPSERACRACHYPPHVSPDWDLTRAWRDVIGPGHGETSAPPRSRRPSRDGGL